MDHIEIPTPIGTYARVIKDWDPIGTDNENGNCMSLRVGEVIMVRSRLERGWWHGTQVIEDSRCGWFPGYCCAFNVNARDGEVRL